LSSEDFTIPSTDIPELSESGVEVPRVRKLYAEEIYANLMVQAEYCEKKS
jgi:hypothetical protein